MILFAVLVALETAALVLAARRFGWRAPLTIVLGYALADEVAVEILHRLVFTDPDHPLLVAIERFGWPAQALYHVESAVIIGWPALIAGAAWRVFGHKTGGRSYGATTVIKPGPNSAGAEGKQERFRPAELLFGAWLIAAGGMAACFPLPRGMTAVALHGVELAFVAAAMAALPSGWRSRAVTKPEGRALGLIVVVELVVALLGAWGAGAGVFDRETWDTLSRIPYCIGWLVLCVMLARR